MSKTFFDEKCCHFSQQRDREKRRLLKQLFRFGFLNIVSMHSKTTQHSNYTLI